AAIAGQAGNDDFGNSYPAGAQFGASGQSQVQIIPNQNSAFNVTAAIAGVLQAVTALTTNDVNEVLAGFLGSVLLGSGTSAKMSTVLSSPIGGGQGAALILEAQNDAETDTAIITFGVVTTPDSSTEIYTPIMTLSPYALIVYGGGSGTTTITKKSGSGTIPIPVGVTVGKGESWAGGQKGGNGALGGGGGGGGSGEYAAEPALALTGGGTAAYSVGVAGAASTLTGSAVTVTAHPGTVGGNATPTTPGTP